MKIDLVTGFLGSGKTTFITKYLPYLQNDLGEKVALVENEFSPLRFDSGMLEGAEVESTDLTGFCMCCTGTQRFKGALLNYAAEGYDRVVVEPSGIYDADTIFQVLSDPVFESRCEIGNIITLYDGSGLGMEDSEEASYLTFTQVNVSGAIFLTHMDLLNGGGKTSENPDEAPGLNEAKGRLKEIMERFGGSLSDKPIIYKSLTEFTPEDFNTFASCGYVKPSGDTKFVDHKSTFDNVLVPGSFSNRDELLSILEKLFNTEEFGNVYRIKGYLKDGDGHFFAMNCTRSTINIEKAEVKRGMLVVIGQNLKGKEIQGLFAG